MALKLSYQSQICEHTNCGTENLVSEIVWKGPIYEEDQTTQSRELLIKAAEFAQKHEEYEFCGCLNGVYWFQHKTINKKVEIGTEYITEKIKEK